MRIGMIVHAFYLRDARVRRYAELLVARGHQVDVLCLREPGNPKRVEHGGVKILGVQQRRLRGGRLSYLYEDVSAFLRFFIRLNWLYLTGTRYDVIHIHNMPNFLVFCAFFQKLLGTRIILDLHDLMPEICQSKYKLDGDHWLTHLLRIEERVSASFASVAITANHIFAEKLVRRGLPTSKITVVMNAADEKFSHFALNQSINCTDLNRRGFHVMYVGTLAPRYGLEIAIGALARLNDAGSIPGLSFTIIPKIENEGAYADHVLNEIRQRGLECSFKLLKPVPHHEMPTVIAGADAIIYTPMPDIHMDIALSLKIPEAIAIGRPVIASRLTVHERYFGEEALFMFEPGNVEDCAARVLEVHNHPARAKAKVAYAKSRLQEIAWDKQAQAYLKLLADPA
jgi:glycosyltransferase involved in cell wall biosynthesis